MELHTCLPKLKIQAKPVRLYTPIGSLMEQPYTMLLHIIIIITSCFCLWIAV